MKLHIYILCPLFLFSLVSQAQIPKYKFASVLDRVNQTQGIGAHRTTATTGSRLVGNFNGNGNSGSYQNHDSSTYSYSGTHAGINFATTPQVLSNGMILDGDFDNGYNWSWDNTSSTYKNNIHIANTYDAGYHLLTEILQFWSGSAWENASRTTNLLDATGLDTSSLSESWNSTSSVWENSDYDRYMYDASGNDTLEILRTWNTASSSWDNTYRVHTTYTTSGSMLTLLQETWNGVSHSWRNDSKDVWTYSASGKETSVTTWHFDTLSSTWTNYYQGAYYYNSSDQAIGYATRNGSGSTWANFDSSSYTSLNASGDPLTILTFSWSSGSWQPSGRQTYTYSGPGLAVTGLYETWNGSSFVNSYRTTATFNGFSQVTSSYTESWNGSAWAITGSNEAKRYYYETYSTAVPNVNKKGPEFSVYPSPASDNIILNIPIAQSYTATIFDCSGKLYKQWREEATANYTKKISLQALPSGSYIIEVQSNLGNSSKEFVVQH